MSTKKRLIRKIKYSLRWIPDNIYIQIYYFAHFRKFCNLKTPVLYNEKLNWLKLHDHNPLYTLIVDKYQFKKYIQEKLGGGYTIPTLGVWDNFNDIEFDELPNQFVIKCTHDSAGIVIVPDKNKLDIEEARKQIEFALKQNFYYIGREWPYKNVKPQIIIEQYMSDHVDGELRDYKFFCFNGEPKMMLIASERKTGNTKFDYYDLEFNHLDIRNDEPNANKPLRKPSTFEDMIRIARILSQDFYHVRVDFYEVDGKLYVGELTLYHNGGFDRFRPKEWNKIMGDWLVLPSDKK